MGNAIHTFLRISETRHICTLQLLKATITVSKIRGRKSSIFRSEVVNSVWKIVMNVRGVRLNVLGG